jgi:osmotically-inducible protein OsmY
MRKLLKFGVLGGIGAAIAYFFDRENGRRRRALVRDRSEAWFRSTRETAEHKSRYASDKMSGVKHEVFGSTETEAPNDATVAQKIRSEVLRHYDTSRVNVNVEDGIAVLRGELKHPEEINALVRDVERVAGVRDVRSLLHLPT